ncbi:DNA repair protein [Patellaria atrata CBS 101060]|uniref:DNA repair protein REV1 n=1 Tax=Patellaria atrata CBS 101060 TaxID=1346257 RepID=A0A9P4S2F9_9PEZI|nr:DNA repair protein [Patellaria atrata CBS 101060]
MGSRLEANSSAVRKRIENHTFNDEEGEEYSGSKFGGFGDYFRRKQIKLQNLDAEIRSKSTENPPIFRGIVAHVNGYTQPSLNDLHKLIVSHGGGFLQYLEGKTAVTHIIASSLTPKKAVEFRKYRIVKPAWIVDSVNVGRLLPWNSYRVIDEGAGQRVLGFDGGKVVSEKSAQKRGYRDQTDSSWYTSQLGQSIPSPYPIPFLKKRPLSPEADNDTLDAPSPGHITEEDADDDYDPDFEVENEHMHSPTRQALETPPVTSPADDKITKPTETEHSPEGESHSLKRHLDDGAEPPSKLPKLTAEKHNAILLSDPRIRKSSVVNPDFLEQYYRESRLHHLSTWKADLKSELQAMAAEKSSSQKAKQKRAPGARRYILHVDFDSFFATVSLKKYPQYQDKPAVVAHSQGTGSEIASCNYPARKFGIKNGMWMKAARELCPDLKILPYDFPAYEEASRAFYSSIIDTRGLVQSVSVDEALIDVSNICIAEGGSDGKRPSEGSIYREQAKADALAKELRKDVKQKTGCDVSVGIGGNILLAKVALRKAKPAGQYQIKPDEVLSFIGELEVQNLPGVAYSIGGKLEELGIKFIKDIREVSKEKLVTKLGPKTGEKLWEYARGIDRTEVGDQIVRKSVSVEVNWGVRFENHEQVDEFIQSLSGELRRRLLKEGVKGKQLTMKIMKRSADAPLDPPKHLGHGKCDTYNKSVALGVSTNDDAAIMREALSMLKGFGITPGELRGIGIQMTKLEPMKLTVDGQSESSQKRLPFKTMSSRLKDNPVEDANPDEIQTPKKPKAAPNEVTFGSNQLASSSPSKRPLNTLGTQFMLPTQVDPKVLAELPEDIRAKLTKQYAPPQEKSLPSSPLLSKPSIPEHHVLNLLPNQSQLDTETLNALPDDVRSEILAAYTISPSRRRQTLLPQSPRKDRILPKNLLTTAVRPTKPRGRGRPPKVLDSNSTLTQSSFILNRPASRGTGSGTGSGTESDTAPMDVEAEFLAALPEDIRREVLEEQRRARLKKNAGIAYNPNARSTKPVPVNPSILEEGEPQQAPERTLKLPPRPPPPSFTTQKLSKIEDLRGAVRAWWDEFRTEGPYPEDVGALASYLKKVVLEERNMSKAVMVARWVRWVVEEGLKEAGEEVNKREREIWKGAVERVVEGVKGTVKERGLGEVGI